MGTRNLHLQRFIINHPDTLLYNAKGGGIGSDTNKAVVFMHNSLKIDEIDKKMEEIYHFYFKNGIN